VEVCAGADEEEHDQEEGLELENAEHGGSFSKPTISIRICNLSRSCVSSLVLVTRRNGVVGFGF